MKNLLRLAAAVALLGAMALGLRQLHPMAQVATGYAAKQLCSGVFVAGLPETFILEKDIRPRMAILGPARPLLRHELDTVAGTVRSTLLTASSTAVVAGDRGCILNPREPGAAAFPEPGRAPADRVPVAESGALRAALDTAFAEPAEGGRNTLAVLVAKNGQVLAERYQSPVSAQTPLQGWSMNKSLLATWVGMQVATGRLSLDLPVRQALELAGASSAVLSGIDQQLNLGHLLQMESGFDFEETYQPGDDATRMLYRSPAMWQAAPGKGHAHPPGSHFSYSSGDTNLAAYLWQRSLDGEPYEQWIARRFAQPLDLRKLVAEPDSSGVQVGSSYTYMPARDWLAVGQFWLDAWHERSELLPAGWQRAATRPRPSDPQGRYGRGFWLNTAGNAFPGLPEEIFYASGNAGQAVVVFPAQELVVVRLSLTDTGVDSGLGQLLADVYRAVVVGAD